MTMFKVPRFLKATDARNWRYVPPPSTNVNNYLRDRQLGGFSSRHENRWNSSSYAVSRVPTVVREREINMAHHDKIFAALWLSHNEVIMGTKCNRLVIENIDNDKRFEIPLVQEQRNIPSTPASTDLEQFLNAPSHCTGIHSLAINPSGTLLAVGAGQPIEVTIYRLPSFEPLAVLTGHTDMVFAIAWIDDDVLMSGSRDTSVRVWSASSLEVSEMPILDTILRVHEPLLTLREHKNKVRDLKYNKNTKQILSLSTEGCVRVWDSTTFASLGTVSLHHTNETVTIGMNEQKNLYSVGSLEHVSVIDARVGGVVHDYPSLDENWGVRSLSFDEHVITTGGGMGRIAFYDLRATKHIELPEGKKYIQTGPGWLNHDSTYTSMFQGLPIYNAVYSVIYDVTGTRLFAAGGPLQLGLCGSYAAVFV